MARRQYFTTLDDAELDILGGSCREYTFLRDNATSKVKGWIRGNTKIGLTLEVTVSHHQGRYGIEIIIESSFGDGILFLGDDREWKKQIRDGDDGGNPRRPHRVHWRMYSETCC